MSKLYVLHKKNVVVLKHLCKFFDALAMEKWIHVLSP